MKIDRLVLIVTSTIALISVAIYFSTSAIKIENNIFHKVKSNISLAVVIPHHDLVKDIRSSYLKKLSLNSQPKTIILVSVNHFNAGSAEIITSDEDWLVANGTKKITADIEVINSLKESGLVKIESAAFLNEHGIKNLLGEIKEFFPGSKLVPLIIKETVGQDKIKELAEVLELDCSDCGFIASVDMSHYQPAHLAEIHDEKTLRALTILDEEEVWQTETDSNAALALLIDFAKNNNLNKFNLFAQTNSGLIAKNLETETTTHILGNYSSGEEAKVKDELSFTFAGDSMFGRNVGYYFQKNNFIDLFSNLGNRTLWGTDISWLNLEGPISDKEIAQDPNDDSLVFNFSKEVIEALKYLKITAVGLANNHTANKGAAGLNLTKEVLEKAKIDWNGEPNKIDINSIKRYEQGDLTVALVPINTFASISGINELIKEEKNKNNFVIVLPHWGNEYQPVHSAAQEKLARALIEAGADLIIGMHPHVIQDAEIINNKLVFYSLGNFIFDQMFSAETQEGLILSGIISSSKLKLVLTPVVSKKMKPEIMQGADRQRILDMICLPLMDYCKDDVIEI